MPASLMLACFWGIVANLAAMLPSRDNHWTSAYLLSASGLPILGYVVWESGLWVGLLVLLAMMSVLRWPVLSLWRWLRQRIRPGA